LAKQVSNIEKAIIQEEAKISVAQQKINDQLYITVIGLLFFLSHYLII